MGVRRRAEHKASGNDDQVAWLLHEDGAQGSDAGSRYTSFDYTQRLEDHRVLASIGTVGDACDNALAESFVDSFKTELIADRVWRTRAQLELGVVEYLGWSNAARPHSSHGYLTPAEIGAE